MAISTKQIDYCLLDLGGVVFQSTGRKSEAIDWSIISRLNHQYGHELNLGKDLFPTFLENYNEQSTLQLSGDEFLKEVFDTLDVNQSLVDHLKQHFPICILSDNYRENIAYISKRYRFSDWTNHQFYSFQYGMTKANPALFQEVLQELTVQPERVLFIDDYAPHIQTAASLGIRGIQFVNNTQVFAELERMFD